MTEPQPRVLEYATPPDRGRRDPAIWPPLNAFWIGVIVQLGLAIIDEKTTSGGPFISIHGEVVPVLIWLVMTTMGARCLFAGKPSRRLVVAIFLAISTLIALGAVMFVVSYWQSPYSRGALIGF
jgi:hypothetical protein